MIDHEGASGTKYCLLALAAVLVASLVVAGCLVSSSDSASPELYGTIWILDRVEGFSPLHDRVNVYIIFDRMNGRIGGYGRTICNSYGIEAQYLLSGKVRFYTPFSTEVGCGVWNDLEAVYYAQLKSSSRFKLDDGVLRFYNSLDREVLRYRPGTPVDTLARL